MTKASSLLPVIAVWWATHNNHYVHGGCFVNTLPSRIIIPHPVAVQHPLFGVSVQESGGDHTTNTHTRGSRSLSFPLMFPCSTVLRESTLAGNAGFDPLGFATSQEQLWQYREAEIKHARLAMLVAVAWPLVELYDRTNDPTWSSTMLGHLNFDRVSPTLYGGCLGFMTAVELYGAHKAASHAAGRQYPDYIPGDLGFDPLLLYPPVDKNTNNNDQQQQRMQLAEIKHGRIAMLAVVGYWVQEQITQMSVVEDTSLLFQPVLETISRGLW